MYALVGEATMKDPDTSASLSWKRGFLHNKVKGNINTHALLQVQVKRAPKNNAPTSKNQEISSNRISLQVGQY